MKWEDLTSPEFDEAIELVKRLPIKNKKIFQSEILIAKGD